MKKRSLAELLSTEKPGPKNDSETDANPIKRNSGLTMQNKPFFFQHQSAFVQVLLVYIWMTNLAPLSSTDTYYTVYLMWGVMGLICMASNCRCPIALSRKELLSLGFCAVLFSAAAVAGNYSLFEPLSVIQNLFNCVCCLMGGSVVGLHILAWMLRCDWSAAPERKKAWRIGVFVFLFIAGLDLLYLFQVRFPGVLTTDSITTIRQLMGTQPYDNTMPFWHTMTVKLFVQLGLAIFGDINSAVALFHVAQILFLAGCFSYSVMTLYEIGIPKAAVFGVFLLYAIVPYQIVYSVTLWKDMLFAGAALLMVTALLRILRRQGNVAISQTVFAIGAAGLCLWRTNGWFAAVFTFLLFLVLMRREKRLLVLLGTVIVICWVLLNPVLNLLGVQKTDYMEAFAVPFQQIARVVANDREMSEGDRELLAKVFDLEKMREKYDPLTVDPIKFETFDHSQTEYLREHWREYLSLYLRMARQNPGDFAKAWIDETKGYWNGGYFFWIYTKGVDRNEFGLVSTDGTGIIARCFAAAFRYLEKPEFLQPIYSIGVHIWVIISSFVVCILRKKKEALLSVPLLVLTVGLWLGTPVYAEFRYAYPMILTAPVILCATLFPNEVQ